MISTNKEKHFYTRKKRNLKNSIIKIVEKYTKKKSA